ncbi:hypothetical protein GOP47_0003726 [Adiantum capillus-veneris]|uniref:Xyloglucan endotransglucosylase/hydrolase n=1 Tax=Adiantum capillus-veneris TaxID=13818 RepID=A0A9D4ZLY0_ADICA|nr:hypothetical protein GOP47_0003726 [Adiantum capillus-veneris]
MIIMRTQLMGLILTIMSAIRINALPVKEFARLEDMSGRFQALSFTEAYSVIWGSPSISSLEPDHGDAVHLKLDKTSGSGFVSLENYMYGFYSTSIKFPVQDYAAGIVLAFYTSNGDEFPSNHDELDFEFLGNIKGRPWRMQTNVYGNGSVAHGREERFDFWFNPTADYHNYSILWNQHHIVFMVDSIPIREMIRSEPLEGDYPSKPMGMYATLWDGSAWATDGGRFKVDYKYAPFIASFKSLKMQGCAANPFLQNLEKENTRPLASSMGCTSLETDNSVNPLEAEFLSLSPQQEAAMAWVRSTYMYYSYCDDKSRYPTPLPECTSRVAASSRVLRSRKQRTKRANYRSFNLTSARESGF